MKVSTHCHLTPRNEIFVELIPPPPIRLNSSVLNVEQAHIYPSFVTLFIGIYLIIIQHLILPVSLKFRIQNM
jgi:hypothetical protein